jgi:hypothetical protein
LAGESANSGAEGAAARLGASAVRFRQRQGVEIMKLSGVLAGVGAFAALSLGGTAFANDPHSAGTTGQPSQSCQATTPPNTPGNAGSNLGSVFSPSGQSGTVYAGQPGTPSLANGNSHAVSQYDVACFQQTKHQMP